jgi:hypothetical protein
MDDWMRVAAMWWLCWFTLSKNNRYLGSDFAVEEEDFHFK